MTKNINFTDLRNIKTVKPHFKGHRISNPSINQWQLISLLETLNECTLKSFMQCIYNCSCVVKPDLKGTFI